MTGTDGVTGVGGGTGVETTSIGVIFSIDGVDLSSADCCRADIGVTGTMGDCDTASICWYHVKYGQVRINAKQKQISAKNVHVK